MSGRDNARQRRWWLFLIRPYRAFQELFARGPNRFNLLVIFLGGICLFQVWAAFFALGDDIEVGKIMTATLILGPLTGLLSCVLTALFCMNLGCLLDPEHRVGYEFRAYLPPFPLRHLLLHPLIGRKRTAQLLHHPVLAGYTRSWSVFRSYLRMLGRNLSGGKASFSALFSGASAALTILLFADLIMVIELAFFAPDHFTSAPLVGIRTVFAGLKIVFIVWWLMLWAIKMRAAFQLPWPRTLLATLSALILTIFVVLQLLLQVFALPIFGF